ncbi:AMP-binding protein [Ferrimonas balearica]|uniref:AMP-binding protein n=1 Tax=Ferrimonas balearica TaxID=44012 RepID=UPI001C58BCBE|nr:AMP-binding protein [Ferrimonas balearica]MBW3164028.1 AMP-binding protein [Ferrimonas balearica]
MKLQERLLNGPDGPVCHLPTGTLSLVQLRQEVARVQDSVAEDADRVLLYSQCSGQFLIRLLALLGLGRTVVLPANGQSDTLAALAGEADAVIDDQWQPQPTIVARPQWQEGGRVRLFTSGSSGQAKAVDKALFQLESELAVLDALFGERVGDSVMVASVSHQHIYGLLFRLLWPFASGRPFLAETLPYPESVEQAIERFGAVALVASPALLERLQPRADQAPVLTFSSGGPLPRHAAQRLSECWGAGAVEVYGSTETGGIAWRQAVPELRDPPWRPMPGIALRQQEGKLSLRSPYLPDAQWYDTEDLIEFVGDGFVLLGRADRIVKLAEKRVSLPHMEAHLLSHEWVQQAALVMLPGARPQLGAVLVLTETGEQNRQQQGNFAFAQQLKTHLFSQFERVTLPRRWRYLEYLPVNAQGKLPQQVLREQFDV